MGLGSTKPSAKSSMQGGVPNVGSMGVGVGGVTESGEVKPRSLRYSLCVFKVKYSCGVGGIFSLSICI